MLNFKNFSDMSEKIIFTEKEVDEIRDLYLNQN